MSKTLQDLKRDLKHLQREAYLLSRSDLPIDSGDHPSGTACIDPTFSMIDCMLDSAYWLGVESVKPQEAKK